MYALYVWQALRSRQKLREFLGAHLFRALCSAHVSNSAYADVPCNTGIEPTEGGWPSEDVVHQLLPDTTAEDKGHNDFDYGVFGLLWPRRDLSTLEDLTRLVLILRPCWQKEATEECACTSTYSTAPGPVAWTLRTDQTL